MTSLILKEIFGKVVRNSMQKMTIAFKGKSMGSLLKEGDKLTIKLFDQPRTINSKDLGKIVLFKDSHEWILHRVVMLNNKLVVKGDHSLIADELSDGKIWGELQNCSSSRFYSRLSRWYSNTTPRFFRYFIGRIILAAGHMNRWLTRSNQDGEVFFSLLRGESPHLDTRQVRKINTLARRHFLAPYLYDKLNKKNIAQFFEWKKIQKIEGYKETYVLFELQNLKRNLPKELVPALIKGASLIKRVYKRPGLRFMSDVDMLLAPEEKAITETILLDMGYIRITEDHGPAHRCKSIWTKPMLDSEMIIELHEKLNWFQPPDFKWKFVPSQIPGYKQLDLYDEIIYLSIHLTYSHNFQRLFWLVDIYELLKENKEQIDWPKIKKRASMLNAEKAMTGVLIALNQTHGLKLDAWPITKYPSLNIFITKDFLLNPYASMLRFLILKHILQDKLLNALKYDFYRIMISVKLWLK